ncbi:hypothetical protein V2I01_10970 [Micromonospora sp. BRA006-A]|nr:hypothetical protein [Micromonospora sp. BRA006-A]
MPRKQNPPKARCTATAQTSGEPCRRYATPAAPCASCTARTPVRQGGR